MTVPVQCPKCNVDWIPLKKDLLPLLSTCPKCHADGPFLAAVQRAKLAGTAFRPSNGTEGMIFEETWCDRCTHSMDCDLQFLSMIHEINESEYPKQWVHDAEGKPTCTEFEDKGRVTP